MSHLILIGLRGSGKTTVGRGLAPRLGLPHIDLDEAIVARVGMSIPKMIYEHGWEYFRDQETLALVEATSGTSVVLSTGGGAISRPYNRELLKRSGLCIWLQASAQTHCDRIRGLQGRPPLTTRSTLLEEIEQLLEERHALYQEVAHLTVNTECLSPDEVIEQILHLQVV